MIDRGKHSVLGVRLDAVDYDAAVDRVIRAAAQRRPLAVSALAVHGVMTGVQDPGHRYRLNAFDLLVPDGQPVRWALRWLHGVSLADRVYGPTLMIEVCRRAAAEGLSVFLYGGTDAMLARLTDRLTALIPRLQLAGAEASRFRQVSEEERDAIVTRIRSSGAALTFVGLGCPRQEVWTFEMRDALSMPLLAVGAAFAFHAGMLPQAPRWLQDHGLEWTFRLAREPRRLWKRYLVLNPAYLSLLALQRTGLRRFDAPPPKPASELRYG